MKRYQKKRFACGIACLILAVICGSVMAAEGVSVKLAVSALLLTALGGGDLLLSMDKTIQMPRPDERDRQVVQTSAWRAYRILVHGCLAAGIILAAAYGAWRMPELLAALITVWLVVLVSFGILLGCNLYYEERM